MLGGHESAAEGPPLTIKDGMQGMFNRPLISQMVAKKPVEDQAIYSHMSLAIISGDVITAIFDEIRRPGGLVGKRTLDRESTICSDGKKSQACYIHV